MPHPPMLRLSLFLALATLSVAQPAPTNLSASGSAAAPTLVALNRAGNAPLVVDLDHADWTYPLGTPAQFHITVKATPFPAGGVPIKYKLGPEMREAAEVEAIVPATGLTIPISSPAAPGFIRCIVTTTLAGKPVRAVATAGFSPEKLKPTQVEPPDFDAFWTGQKAQLAKIAPDYQLTPDPALSTPGVEVFQWSAQNVSNGATPSRFFGVLCVPRGPGPFPALLNPPGAGVRGYTGLVKLAEKGIITLQVGIHGIPVNMPASVYEQLSAGALNGYQGFNLDNNKRFYYRRVYLGCLRANDYLVSHPKWDHKNLVVMGGSQGGQLSIVTAALDPRVTALAANYPAFSDVSGYARGRTGGWPNMFRPGADGSPSTEVAIEAKLTTTTYYDTVNFARRLKVPGLYFWGYNDEICAPTSTFTAYNVITAPKQLFVQLDQGHWTPPAQQDRIDAWVLAQTAKK